ncbi:uncharacterized protein BDZ99DRAFT_460855 [Mytilinidion resinicola]|uniref:Nucleoprotein TPR/MLP1-2 domain-containing protein n=1 Tax=Mytilinidion resinicola TaxID=574789 RepID=A0A6A6YUL2_9PEZI|nr:uncharacterized protein BDZ99DRAFT_460855 [Mytilinidion resinicola]KAF2812073.1 hypothetical protein BDZ99DRAFT_460855 [Mytilinidion resinicola]
MKIELRTAEERAHTLQPRPTPRTNGANGTAGPTINEDGLSREQELALEISDLKRDLELARGEVETTKVHIESYKGIAQASEEELASLNDTYEQYHEETESTIAEKDARIKDLEQRVDEISSELATTNQELSEVRRAQEESATTFNQQKEVLESEIIRLKDDCERYQETAKMHQEDLKAQAEIAKQAQQSYENELVRHGEATKTLRTVREEYNTLRTEVADIKAQGEAARTTLAQSEEHWNETRQRYERELGELRTRNEDMKSQNKILHQQLENVSSQIASLKQSRVSIAGGEEDIAGSPSSGLESLQEVIRYLRQEKEIVDVQYELSIQEAKRLKQQLDHAQNQLDQTREKLNSERQTQADKEQNALSHSKLMETLEQLNLFRESSATLRNEARQAQAQLAEKMKEVEDLVSQIQPLQTRVRELDNALETKNGEYELLEQDRDRYQKRAQDILQKYDRVDPAELEELKSQLKTLQTERDQAVTELQPLQEQLNGVEERIRVATEAALAEQKATFDERRQKLVDQSKSRDKDNRVIINGLKQEREGLQQQIAEVKTELETTKTALEEALANVKPTDTSMDNSEEGQVDEGSATGFSLEEKEALQARINEAEGRVNQEANRAVNLHIQVDALQGRVRELENQIAELHQRVATANTEVAEAKAQKAQLEVQVQQLQAQVPPPANQDTNGDSSEEIEKLKEELAITRKEADDLRINAAIAAATSAPSDSTKSITDQVAEQVALIRTELEAAQIEKIQAAETLYQSRTEKMKNSLQSKLKDGKETIKQQLQQEHEDAMEQLRSEHEAAIQQLNTEHQAEIATLHEEARLLVQKGAEDQPAKTEQDKSVDGAAAESADGPEKEPIAWDAPESVIKHFVSNHPVVKEILIRNVQKKLAQEKEAAIAEAIEEQTKVAEAKEKELNDTYTKKINNYEMDLKKANLKGGMLENIRARISVVQQAAKETPERPVGEVWAIAEKAKPPQAKPGQVAQAASATQMAVPAQPAPLAPSASLTKPTESTQSAQSTQAVPPTPPQQPIANQPASHLQPPTGPHDPSQPSPTAFGQPGFGQAPQGSFAHHASAQPQNPFANRPGSFGQTNIPGQNRPGSFGQPLPSQVQPNLFGQQPNMAPTMPGYNNQANMGRASPAFGGLMPNPMMQQQNPLRSNSPANQQQQQFPGQQANQFRQHLGQSMQTGIPRGGGLPRPVGRGQQQQQNQNQGGNQNQSQLPRGGRRGGGGRGSQQQHIQTGNLPQGPAAQNSPKGSMNPAARQFNPGSSGGSGMKRPREDGDGTDGGHQGGKRARGGAGGAN